MRIFFYLLTVRNLVNTSEFMTSSPRQRVVGRLDTVMAAALNIVIIGR